MNMSNPHEYSLPEKLLEELTFLPGRFSRYFFLIASLDTKVERASNDIDQLKTVCLNYLSSDTITGVDKIEKINEYFNLITKLQKAQKQFLVDKLDLEKNCIEWFKKAQQYIVLYNNEIDINDVIREFDYDPNLAGYYFKMSKYRSKSELGHPVLSFQDKDIDGISSNSYKDHYLKKRRQSASKQRTSIFDENSYISDIESLNLFKQLSNETDERIDAIASSRHSECSNKNFISNSTEGLIIKLGSQKGRPRKSTNRQRIEAKSSNTQISELSSAPTVEPEITIDEYICPICMKSENENPSMVACDSCDRWYHCFCVDFVDDAHAAEKAFECLMCKKSQSHSNT